MEAGRIDLNWSLSTIITRYTWKNNADLIELKVLLGASFEKEKTVARF